jgi:Zn-finger in ubiquitin-hydrolases and other protein
MIGPEAAGRADGLAADGERLAASGCLVPRLHAVRLQEAPEPAGGILVSSEDTMPQREPCPHLRATTNVTHPKRQVCEICVETGGTWVKLRTCQQCGVTLCCDSSPNRHASRHAKTSGHPVIASAEPGERWLYCYLDDQVAQY